jgi:hypothetical protein
LINHNIEMLLLVLISGFVYSVLLYGLSKLQQQSRSAALGAEKRLQQRLTIQKAIAKLGEEVPA